ncbi:hypothetical protein YC2023_077627 [Brassica napus]
MYLKLHRILLLDDDVVVHKDLTGHWEIDMNRKVNGGCRDLCRFVPLLERGQLLKADPYLGLREANSLSLLNHNFLSLS